MNKHQLVQQIRLKQSLLCVGLDSDFERLPRSILENYADPVFEFNRRIIKATCDHCVAYKFNLAFYEAQGLQGWESLVKSLKLVPPDILTIADAKRGDIGNTSRLYAKTFFETMSFDALTISPYMGHDSIKPFYAYDGKWLIILGLTSNPGSKDYQLIKLSDDEYLFENVIKMASLLGTSENTMFVVGATQPEYMARIRNIIPDHFLLIPGIGHQGGNLRSTLQHGLNKDFGLLINSSRGIIFASAGDDFDEKARDAALALNRQIASHVKFHG